MSDFILPAGRHLARATEAALGKTSKGGEQVAVSFAIVAPESLKGHTITWYGYFTEKTVDRTLESLEHCGWDGESLSTLNGLGSRDVELVVEHEPDHEDPSMSRARVRWVNAPGGGMALKDRMSKPEAMILEERLKGKMLERKQRAANGRAHSQNAPDEDDTPF